MYSGVVHARIGTMEEFSKSDVDSEGAEESPVISKFTLCVVTDETSAPLWMAFGDGKTRLNELPRADFPPPYEVPDTA